ncbi:MAG: hypothetical protein KF870_17995, partial [Leadbetterella sp.]|nr:hypothetical protein [Leadbetterella sp.]
MASNIKEIGRCFFHELGHLVSRDLNREYFSGPDVEEIKIYPVNESLEKYTAFTKPVVPKNVQKAPTSILKLAQLLALDSYGCIFQSFYLGRPTFENLDNRYADCFRYGDDGSYDYRDLESRLRTNDLSSYIWTFKEKTIVHIGVLKDSKAIESFLELDPYNYLCNNGEENYFVRISELRKDYSLFIKEISKFYI